MRIVADEKEISTEEEDTQWADYTGCNNDDGYPTLSSEMQKEVEESILPLYTRFRLRRPSGSLPRCVFNPEHKVKAPALPKLALAVKLAAF